MTRRSWIFPVFVALLVVSACRKERIEPAAPKPPTTGAFSLRAAAAPYRGTTIRVLGESLPPLEALQKIAPAFERETGIKVQIEGFAYDVMIERGALDLTSRTGRYDVTLQAPESWGKFAARGDLVPMDEFRRNQQLVDPSFDPGTQLFAKPAQDLGSFNGVTYGYPFSALTMDLWYRKDLLTDPAEARSFKARYEYDLRVPATWKEYRDVAEFFTRPQKGLYGTLLQARRHPALWQEWLNFAYSFGGGTMAKAHAWDYGPIIVNSPETVAATTYYKSLLPFAPPGTLEYTWDDALAAMQQGKVVMALMWTDMSSAIEDPAASRVAGKMGFSRLPEGAAGHVAQLSGSAYLIPRGSKNPNAAYLFIQWALRPENQIAQQLAGGQSGYKAVYSDPRVAALPYSRAVFETLQDGVSMRETVPEAGAIAEAVQIGLSDILQNRKTVQDGLDWIAAQMKKTLGAKAELKYPPQRPAA